MRFAELKKANERKSELKSLVERVLEMCNEPKSDWNQHISYALADADNAHVAYSNLYKYLGGI
jgi:hypothetical protein